jgi:hypothetical protein
MTMLRRDIHAGGTDNDRLKLDPGASLNAASDA